MAEDHDADRPGARAATVLAWSLCAVCLALAGVALLLGFLNGRTVIEVFADEGIVAISAIAASYSIVGALVASHRPGNPIGWIFCAAALCQGLSISGYEYATYALLTEPNSLPFGASASWLGQWIWAPGLGLILVFLPLFFPDGRPPSRRWRPVAWLGALSIGLIFFLSIAVLWPIRGPALVRPEAPVEEGTSSLMFVVIDFVAFPMMLLAGLGAALSLFVRFRRARGNERQQIKWFASAVVLTLAFTFVWNFSLDAESGPLKVALAVSSILLVLTIPVATGVAILRHRLYDIDVIINRALVYGTLTATLALVYIGSVVSLQYVFRALTGGNSQLVIVASTLAIAALFSPLRRHIQEMVDRRFYRRKYDARRTLEAFGVRLRDETELAVLSGALVDVVRETVQPAHVSLWIRPSSETVEDANR